MKHLLIYLMLALQIALYGSSALAAPTIPPAPAQNIYVQDYAGVINPQTRASMNAIATELQSKTKSQIVVVTIKSLQGESLEEYSLELLRKWGIGDRSLNNGVLLLVVVNERKSRIEVGYGLEGALPDGLTGRIQDEYMLPFFRQAQYSKGIENGFNALTQIIAKEYKVDIKTQSVVKPISRQQQQQAEPLPTWATFLIGAAIVGLLIIDQVFLGGSLLRMIIYIIAMGRGGGRGGGGGGFGGGSGGGGGSSRSW